MAVDEQLRTLLAAVEVVDVRLVCFRVSAGWRVKRVYARPLEAPPQVPERLVYATHLFLRAAQPVADFLALLEALHSEEPTVSVQGMDLTHQKLHLNPAEHYPAGHRHWGLEQWPIPTWHYGGSWAASANSSDYEQTTKPLIAMDAPYFPRVLDGEAWFLLERGVEQRRDTVPEILIIIPDRRAYMTGIDIAGDTYTVQCAGSRLSECQLRLYTSVPQLVQQPAEAVCRFVIEGEPETMSIALTLGSDWLDRREVNSGTLGLGKWSADDVRRSDTVDTVLSIKELARRHGESATLEFKANAGESGKPAEKNRFLQSVVAFANTAGGTILVGVDDDGMIVGAPAQDTVERIRNLIEDSVRAVPPVEVTAEVVDGEPVIVVRVTAGAEKPYALLANGNKYLYYVRRDASNKLAKPEDFRTMLPSATQSPSPYELGLRWPVG